ncbi:MAG: hypothetical protein PVH19_15635 [Planctomycetia bacterium]|jgi:hypothetical protein
MKFWPNFFLAAIVMVVMVSSLAAQQFPQPFQQPVRQAPQLRHREDPSERLGFDQVMWSGGGLRDLKPLEGKSVLLFVYASTCPDCNQWSGELFRQLMEATKDRPIVILAINAEEGRPTLRYVRQRGFGAPNILHGYDPNMTARLGFFTNRFQYVWIDSKGLVKDYGAMGTKAQGVAAGAPGAAGVPGAAGAPGAAGGEVKPPVFTLVKKLQAATDLGEFKLLQPGLPPEAAALLWPVEMGRPINSMTLSKVRRVLKGEQKEKFEETINKYLDGQLEQIKKLAEGDVPARLEAYTLAESFVKNLRSSPQAKEVRKIFDTLKKDRDFKKELAAMRIYEKATAESVPPQRRLGMLRNLVKRYKDTYYAQKASEELPAE